MRNPEREYNTLEDKRVSELAKLFYNSLDPVKSSRARKTVQRTSPKKQEIDKMNQL